jgi:hypothetical protein
VVNLAVGIFKQVKSGTFQIYRSCFGITSLPLFKETEIESEVLATPEDHDRQVFKLVKTTLGLHQGLP